MNTGRQVVRSSVCQVPSQEDLSVAGLVAKQQWSAPVVQQNTTACYRCGACCKAVFKQALDIGWPCFEACTARCAWPVGHDVISCVTWLFLYVYCLVL
jgi:hypothetical protein